MLDTFVLLGLGVGALFILYYVIKDNTISNCSPYYHQGHYPIPQLSKSHFGYSLSNPNYYHSYLPNSRLETLQKKQETASKVDLYEKINSILNNTMEKKCKFNKKTMFIKKDYSRGQAEKEEYRKRKIQKQLYRETVNNNMKHYLENRSINNSNIMSCNSLNNGISSKTNIDNIPGNNYNPKYQVNNKYLNSPNIIKEDEAENIISTQSNQDNKAQNATFQENEREITKFTLDEILEKVDSNRIIKPIKLSDNNAIKSSFLGKQFDDENNKSIFRSKGN